MTVDQAAVDRRLAQLVPTRRGLEVWAPTVAATPEARRRASRARRAYALGAVTFAEARSYAAGAAVPADVARKIANALEART